MPERPSHEAMLEAFESLRHRIHPLLLNDFDDLQEKAAAALVEQAMLVADAVIDFMKRYKKR